MILNTQDNRTRTSSRSFSTTAPELECDERFERQLPPELRAELEKEPLPQTSRRRDVASPYLRPPPPPRAARPAPPPVPQTVANPPSTSLPSWDPAPVPPIVARPVRSPSQPGAGPWFWILAMLLAIPVLNALVPHTPPRAWVETRRALPAIEVRKALPVTLPSGFRRSGLSIVSNAQWQSIRMPDGQIVQVSYQGEARSSGSFHRRGVVNRTHELDLDASAGSDHSVVG
jgi:hypothetical protein